jgi:hypothetical protein
MYIYRDYVGQGAEAAGGAAHTVGDAAPVATSSGAGRGAAR